MLLLVLSCSLSLLQQPRPPLGLGLRPALLCGRRVAIVMAADEAAAQRAEQADRAAAALAQLPPGLYNRVSFQSGGMKQAYAEEECLVLWEALKARTPSSLTATLSSLCHPRPPLSSRPGVLPNRGGRARGSRQELDDRQSVDELALQDHRDARASGGALRSGQGVRDHHAESGRECCTT